MNLTNIKKQNCFQKHHSIKFLSKAIEMIIRAPNFRTETFSHGSEISQNILRILLAAIWTHLAIAFVRIRFDVFRGNHEGLVTIQAARASSPKFDAIRRRPSPISRNRMRTSKTSKKVCAAAVAVGLLGAAAACSAGGESAEFAFEPLVTTMAARLQTADAVALTKWDTEKPVYDPQREAAVIADVQAAAGKYQLSASDAAAVFSDQMEANKVVQFTLLNQWRRAGQAPFTARRKLADIRNQLDQLQIDILRNLAAVQTLRDSRDCKAQIARSVGRVATHYQFDAPHLAALDRATASLCR